MFYRMFQRGDKCWHEWSSMLAVSNAHVSWLRAEILQNKIHVLMHLVRCKPAWLCSLSSSVQCCYEMQVSATGECLRSWLNVGLWKNALWEAVCTICLQFIKGMLICIGGIKLINKYSAVFFFLLYIISGSLNIYACWDFWFFNLHFYKTT